MKLIIVPIVAMCLVAGLLGYALYLNIDGTLLAGGIAIIGGLGGYELKILRDKVKKPK